MLVFDRPKNCLKDVNAIYNEDDISVRFTFLISSAVADLVIPSVSYKLFVVSVFSMYNLYFVKKKKRLISRSKREENAKNNQNPQIK